MRRVRATRYVTPLREGGSLPGVVEADDLGTYVCKFRGAGQGVRVLVAEVVVAGLAGRLDVPVPELVAVDLPAEIARYEADEEVQDLLVASVGLNLGVDLLHRAFGYDASYEPDADLAGRILWLDALTANVDRSWRNPNLLLWGPDAADLWAIDHGASLYFHYTWPGGGGDPARFAAQPYDTSEHILRRFADRARAQDADLAGRLTREAVSEVVAEVPEEWLDSVPGAETPAEVRERYVDFLLARVASPRGVAPVIRPYQYLVLRCVPRVVREEFLNLGVVLYCEDAAFLDTASRLDERRLRALDPDLDLAAVRRGLAGVAEVCRGAGRLDLAVGARATAYGTREAADTLGTRFGLLKAPRSTVVQPGPVHSGLCEDPAEELARLLATYVS